MENELKAMLLLVALSFAVAAYAYPLLPESSASHWNASGEVDGYLPRTWAAFFLPVLSLVLVAFFLAIPKIDPLRANIEKFKKDYHRFLLVMLLFLFLIYGQTILWNLGTQISFNLTTPLLMGALFFYLGSFLEKSKQNWFIGIRTPWTLSSAEVWDKTHKFGAKIFKAAGVLAMVSFLLPAYALFVVIAAVVVAAFATIIYSYVAYVNLTKISKSKVKR